MALNRNIQNRVLTVIIDVYHHNFENIKKLFDWIKAL